LEEVYYYIGSFEKIEHLFKMFSGHYNIIFGGFEGFVKMTVCLSKMTDLVQVEIRGGL